MVGEFWRMGATPVPVTEIGRLACEMEADGWDGLAVGEAHGLLPDPYVADGVSFAFGADVDRIAQGIEAVHRACAEHGRDPSELTIGCYVQVAVCDEPDDRERARDVIRGLIITHSRFSGFEGTTLPEVAGDDRATIRRSLDAMEGVLRMTGGGTGRTTGGAPGELDFYPRGAVDDAFIDRFGVVGDAEACARRLQAILDTGVTRVYVGTRAVGIDLEERNTPRIGREVLPLVRELRPASATSVRPAG
jgi:5,10-methylenetetrahydromethanopterin reductase